MDCTPTFNDLLDSDDTENFRQHQMESTAQPQQVNNSCELQSDNNSLKRKQDFDSETSLKTPTKVIALKIDSTSPWMLDPKHGNKIPRLEDCSLYHDPPVSPYAENSQMPILEANTMFSYPGCNNNKIAQEAFGNARQQQHEFQSVHPHRNETYKENSQLIHGQSFITNIFQPDNISDFPIDYSSPLKHDKINALRCIENDPQVHCRKLLKGNALYGLPTSKTYPYDNKRVENQKILYPGVSQQTDDLNYGTRNEITVDKEIQLAGQNKLSSTLLVSETDSQNDNKKRIVMNYQEGSGFPNEVRNTLHTSEKLMDAEQKIKQQKLTQQKKTENREQGKHVEKTAGERDLKHENAYESTEAESTDESAEQESTDESCEMKSTDQSAEHENAKKSADQKNAEQSADQESAERCVDRENAEKSVDQKNADPESAEKSTDRKNVKQSADQKNAAKSANQETAEKSAYQKNVEKSAYQKNVEKSADRENAEKSDNQESADKKNVEETAYQENTKKTVNRKNTRKIANQKNVEKSADQKNVEKSADQKNVEKTADQENTKKTVNRKNTRRIANQKSANQNAEHKNSEKSVEQVNSQVFTGKGYDSIEDFIQALYNNTLYKRY